MNVTMKELRIRPGKIIERVGHGVKVVVTYRGKPLASIMPYDINMEAPDSGSDGIFGLWKKHPRGVSVDEMVRSLRKRRTF
jgi:prevent-host-death family protein